MDTLGPDNAFWIDGEWISWDVIDDLEETSYSRLVELERDAELRFQFPKANPALVPIFLDLLANAEDYFTKTGSHLNIYGQIGELYGAVQYGITLHKNPSAMGSDGKLGDDFVEIKTLSPDNANNRTSARTDRHFSKFLLVNIAPDFRVSGKLMDRKNLTRSGKGRLLAAWEDAHQGDDTNSPPNAR